MDCRFANFTSRRPAEPAGRTAPACIRSGDNRRPMFANPRAFTLIELLVVIGVILILVGMLFVGMRFVGQSGRENTTRAMLNSGRSMLAEYESSAGSVVRTYGGFVEEYENENPPWNPTMPVPAPGNVFIGSPDRDHDVIHATHYAMTELVRVPSNRAILEQIPANRLMADAEDDDHAPVLLDGWNNPIIFVPAGGLNLRGTYPAQQNDPIMTSLGERPYNPAAWPPRNGRPFFASAGQSGSFRTADDNIYSFEE